MVKTRSHIRAFGLVCSAFFVGELLHWDMGNALHMCCWVPNSVQVPSVRHDGNIIAYASAKVDGLIAAVSREMSDSQILANLGKVHGWSNHEMGGGGDCLFLSVAPQVLPADVEELPAQLLDTLGKDIGSRWATLSLRERASLLRKMAMYEEKEFVERLSRSETVHTERDGMRVLEFYRDLTEEFISKGRCEWAKDVPCYDLPRTHARVRELAASTSADDMRARIIEHADEYMRYTGKDGNWAGSSEMVALAEVLQRPFEAYGNNFVSQDNVQVQIREQGILDVLPYFKIQPGCCNPHGPPIRVFQRHGGGHYQMLTSEKLA